MEMRDLTPHGYPGYSIREDGWLFSPKGRMIGGNANGQVRLPVNTGEGTVWRSISWLVATAFLRQPPGYLYVSYKDGDKSNLHYTNLEWSPIQKRAAPKRATILALLIEGLTVEQVANAVDCRPQYVRTIAAERLKELEMIENSFLQGF